MLCYPTHYIRSISKKRAIFLENTHILKISQPVSPFWLFFFQTIPLIQKISKLSLLHEPSLPATRPLLLSHCPSFTLLLSPSSPPPTLSSSSSHPQIGSGSGGRSGGNRGGGRGAVWIVFELWGIIWKNQNGGTVWEIPKMWIFSREIVLKKKISTGGFYIDYSLCQETIMYCQPTISISWNSLYHKNQPNEQHKVHT